MATVELYQGNCLEVMSTLGQVDAVVTDPPYGLGQKMNGGTWGSDIKYSIMREWDSILPQDAIDKLLTLNIPTIIWGGNYFDLPKTRCWLIWDKPSLNTLSDFEMAWTNIDKLSKRFKYRRYWNNRIHPTEKPLPLMKWCIEKVSQEGDTILDPFMGSGTTGVACVQLNRNFIGIEIDPTYFAIAQERIRVAQQQPNLFEAV